MNLADQFGLELLSEAWPISSNLLLIQKNLMMTILAALLIIVFCSFCIPLTSGRALGNRKRVLQISRTVSILSYVSSLLLIPIEFMNWKRKRNAHGVSTLYIGPKSIVVVSDLDLVEQILSQKEYTLSSWSAAAKLLHKCFGTPRSGTDKYLKNCKDFNLLHEYLIKDKYVSTLLKAVSRTLEQNIMEMITFLDTEVDLQPWERWGNAKYISTTESEISLLSLMYMMMGSASISAFFGSALLEKYPKIIQNVFEMNNGIGFFLTRLPAWFPWPGVMKAHVARYEIWQCMNEYQQALDNKADGKPNDPSWGNLDDLSDFINARHNIFREKEFKIAERSDISILWAIEVNANLLVFWLIIYIYSIPGLIERIRTEIAPYAIVTQGITIGKISEAPKLSISPEKLSQNCPLLKACYFETLRLTDRSWSIREVVQDFQVLVKRASCCTPLNFVKGEYIAIPFSLHMQDVKYFKNPETFDPERFIIRKDGNILAEIGSICPYDGGLSVCKGKAFAEAGCLSLVAGVIAYWDLEPADKISGWKIPEQKESYGVSRPVYDFKVRIKRRCFN